VHVASLPAPTDDLDRAEHDLRAHALCAVTGVLDSMLLSNLSGNITGPGGAAGARHADQLFVPTPWPDAPHGASLA
jgi:hypothetical protein